MKSFSVVYIAAIVGRKGKSWSGEPRLEMSQQFYLISHSFAKTALLGEFCLVIFRERKINRYSSYIDNEKNFVVTKERGEREL